MAEDDVITHYVSLFAGFYSKYVSPDKAQKVNVTDIVMSKVKADDINDKFIGTIGETYLNLHKKYYSSSPSPIKIYGEEKKRAKSIPLPPSKTEL